MTLACVFAHFLCLRILAIGLAGFFFAFFVANNISSALGCEHTEGAPWYMMDVRKCITIGNGVAVNTLMGTICEFLKVQLAKGYSDSPQSFSLATPAFFHFLSYC